MKKLLEILVIRLCGINSTHTRHKRDKAEIEWVWTKKSRANSGKSYRKLVIIYIGQPYTMVHT